MGFRNVAFLPALSQVFAPHYLKNVAEVVVVVVVNFIKHQNRAITGERVAARAAPSYQYAMVLVIIT